jgi:hypothetical protein
MQQLNKPLGVQALWKVSKNNSTSSLIEPSNKSLKLFIDHLHDG